MNRYKTWKSPKALTALKALAIPVLAIPIASLAYVSDSASTAEGANLPATSITNTSTTVSTNALVIAGATPNGLPAQQLASPGGVNSDRILNADGTVNWAEYKKVALGYNTDEMLQYRFGPGYSAYHAANHRVGRLPQTGNKGIDGSGDRGIMNGPAKPWSDWFAMSGQLGYVPDNAGDPGMALANNGSVYCDKNNNPVFDYRVSSSPDYSNPWQRLTDPAILLPSWKTLSGGTAPRVPVAVARSRYMTSVAGIAIFANGLIGVTSTGNDPNTNGLGNFPAIRLPAGKVPTAIALTLNHEFALVTVWDTVNRKGQLAVIALEGNPPGIEPEAHFLGKTWWWGQPNWPAIKAIKLLGFVDLPVAAPTSIEATGDISVESGRNFDDNLNMNLADQAQRNDWYGNKGRLRRSAHSGYAVIASRAEGKVVFVDLLPLFQYYRSMYFTTPAKYQVTTTSGPGDNQWPLTFANAPEQQPKVSSTINVPRPTSVAAGFNRGHKGTTNLDWATTGDSNVWDDGSFARSAYVATEAGEMRIYDVGNLNSENASKPAPTLKRSVKVGNNPIAISYGTQAWYALQNHLYVLTRGDKGLVQLRANGDVVKSVTDSRMVDPVNLEITYNHRSCGGYAALAVLDYAGKQVHNYIPGRRLKSNAKGGGVDLTWFFGNTTRVPGKPFLISTAEVM